MVAVSPTDDAHIPGPVQTRALRRRIGFLIRYGDLELPHGAIAQLAVALRDIGDDGLAHKLGRAIDADVDELLLTPEDHAPILRALSHRPIPELADFSRVLETRSAPPASSEELTTLRAKRLAANEAFFRELNQRLERQTPDSEILIVVCECAEEDCAERLELTHREYEGIRSDPTQFVVAHRHADLEIEDVIARTDRFEVVRKLGVGAGVATGLDSTSENESDRVPLHREGL